MGIARERAVRVEFGVLGPLRVWAGGAEVAVPAGKHRALLAALLLRANRTVSVSELIDVLWDRDPPGGARATIQTYVGRLRRMLGAGIVLTRPDGYVIAISDDQLDLARFDRLVEQAGATGDPAEAASLLATALELWRGPPLADVPSDALHRNEEPALAERRLAVLERRIELDLTVGRTAGLVAELRTLTGEHPLRERFWVQLMTALARCGRQGEALQTYEQIRERLADELGVDPGAELQQAHRNILRGTPAPSTTGTSPSAPSAGAVPTPQPRPRPAQLPPDVAGFTGRDTELRALDAFLAGSPAASEGPLPPVISVIEGMAGVGKTALAVHWGHRVRAEFPDGQLYTDLRGYGPEAPSRPIEVLARFLVALGVPAEQVPAEQAAATALYRSLIADQRLLVLLDNAADPQQVRPLLPGGGGCLVLVTSRDRLGGLVARDGAHPMPLRELSPADSQALLSSLIGTDRARAEPAAVAEIGRLCGHLPLALRIAAANLLAFPRLALAAYTEQLHGADRLAALSVTGDEGAAVEAAFDLSYERLAAPEQRMFRLLGLPTGADLEIEAVAALAGHPVARVAPMLATLVAAHLVDQPFPDRYSMHDLLHRYAAERAASAETPADRRAASRRLYDHYLRRTDAAARLLYPQVLRLPATGIDAPTADATVDRPAAGFQEAEQALGWLDREWPNLAATLTQAATGGPRPVAWLLGDWLRGYLWLRRRTVGWPEVAAGALAAAEADQHLQAQTAAQLSLGDLDLVAGRFAAAADHYRAARELADQAGWVEGEAAALGQLGVAYRSLGRPRQAASCHAGALRRYAAVNRRAGEAVCHGNLGVVCEELGRLREAAEHTGQALALFRELGSRPAEANALGNLGHLERVLGHPECAQAHLTAALTLHREIGQPAGEATAMEDLAALHRDRGELAQARELATAAVALTRELSDRFYEASALNTLATVDLAAGRAALANQHHRLALELARQTGDRTHEAEALLGLAAVDAHTGELAAALAHASDSLTVAASSGNLWWEGQAHTTLAEISLAAGQPGRAATHAQQALAIHDQTGDQRGQARVWQLVDRSPPWQPATEQPVPNGRDGGATGR